MDMVSLPVDGSWTHREHEGRVTCLSCLLINIGPTLFHQGHNDGHVPVGGGYMQWGERGG